MTKLKQQVMPTLEIFSYLMAETKDWEMSQICIVSVKFLKDVRDFDRNAANWQSIRKLLIVELKT
jgi:hypothetical protein